MRTFYTVSYPEVSPEAAVFMVNFRHDHDLPRHDVVAAHFTLIFGCKSLPEDEYTRHVESIARGSSAIAFSCQYAMLGADDADDTAYVFLVPNEGFAEISRLHDRLYTGILAPCLRLDVPYVPHITLGTTQDRHAAKALCDELNRQGVRVDGQLRTLTVGVLQDGKFLNLSVHRLNA